MTFAEYIQGKRVVFVGMSPNLVGKAEGEFIDGFDIVVRTNGAIYYLMENEFNKIEGRTYETQADFFHDYGSRCDVIYTNNQFFREQHSDFYKFHALKIKYLRAKNCPPNVITRLREKMQADTIQTVIKEVVKEVPTAAMGCFLIADILRFNPAQLHVTGIDFYASKKQVFEHDNYREYLPGYLTPKIRAAGNKINAGKTKDGHDQYSNTLFIQKKYEQGLVSMSDNLKKLMYEITERKPK